MYLSDQIKCIFQIKLYDINNFAHNLTNANLSAFDNVHPIYFWPLVLKFHGHLDGPTVARLSVEI